MSDTFSVFSLREPLAALLQERKLSVPTPIQREAIPAILNGHDVIAESPTGTGKTLAYLLPVCQNLDTQSKELQALILAPTHELVMQIAREAEAFVSTLGLTSAALIGGVDVKRQLDKLKQHPAVVVATPGRLKELLEMRKIKVHTVKTLVIDEADRMLDRGFAQAVLDISKRTLRDTQRLFFSATLPEEIVGMIRPHLKEPVIVKANAPEFAAVVRHYYLVSEGRKKVDTLRRLLRLVNAASSIVFVNTLSKVEEIQDKLSYHHLECRLIHRDTSKEQRAQTIAAFRAKKFPVLIATDVAARGLDVEGVECIVHFDPATDADAYIHRSGRTGRMGAKGVVFSLIVPQERFILEKFAKQTGIPIEQREMEYGKLVDPTAVKKRPAADKKPRSAAGKETPGERKRSDVHKKRPFGTK